MKKKRIIAFLLCILMLLNSSMAVFANSLSENEIASEAIEEETESPKETVSNNGIVSGGVDSILNEYEQQMNSKLDAYYDELNKPSMMSEAPMTRNGSPIYTPNLPPALTDTNNTYYWFVVQHKVTNEMLLFAARGKFYLKQNDVFDKYSPYPTLTFKYQNGAFYPFADSDYINAYGMPTWKLSDMNFRASNQDIVSYGGNITYILATESSSPDNIPDEPIYTVNGYPPLPYNSLPYWFVCRNKRTGTVNLVSTLSSYGFDSLAKPHDKNGDMRVASTPGYYEFYELTNGKYWILKSKTTSSANIPLYIDDIYILGSNVNIKRQSSLYYNPNNIPVGDTTLTYAFTIPSSLASEGYTNFAITYSGVSGTYYSYVSKEPLKVIKINGAFHFASTSNYRMFTWDKASKNWSLSTNIYPAAFSAILSEMSIEYGVSFIVKANYDIYKYHTDADKYLWFDYKNSCYLNEAGNVTYTIGANGYPVVGGSGGTIGGGGSGGSGEGGGSTDDTNVFLKPIYAIAEYISSLLKYIEEMKAEGKTFFQMLPEVIKESNKLIIQGFVDKINETIQVVKDFFALVEGMRKEGKSFFQIIPELIGLSFEGMQISLGGWFGDIGDFFTEIKTLITNFKDKVIQSLENSNSPILQKIGGLLSSFDDFTTRFVEAVGKILSGEITVPQQLKLFFDSVSKTLDFMKENFIIPKPEDIGKALMLPLELLFKKLFTPTENFEDKLVTKIREKFAFADGLLTTAEELEVFFKTTDFSKPPKINVNFAESKGRLKLGGMVAFIDMSWYAPYKQSGDILISGFLWISFIWRTLKDIPSIINGASSASFDFRAISSEKGGKK